MLKEIRLTYTLTTMMQVLQVALQQPTSSWLHTFRLPETFSAKTMSALESQHVSLKGTKTEIINSIALRILDHTSYPTSEEYTFVCRLLIEKYPFLKDKLGNGYVSSSQ